MNLFYKITCPILILFSFACGIEINDETEETGSGEKQKLPQATNCEEKIGYVYPEGGSLTLEISGHPYADTIEYTCLSTPHINSAGQLYFQFFDQFLLKLLWRRCLRCNV